MNEFIGQPTQTEVGDTTKDPGLRRFMLGVYQKMALGLVLTGAMSWAVANSPFMLQLLYRTDGQYITGYTGLGLVFAFAPLALSLASSLFMRNLNAAVMGLFYWVFVAVMGVSLSSIFLLYTGGSLASTFFITAAAFGALSLAGYTAKINMAGWSGYLTMAVFGLIGVGVVNIFLKSDMLSMIAAAAGVVIFSALIAMQTQMMKQVYYQFERSQASLAAITYYAALSLYISFINLFLSILRLTGGRR